MYKFHSKTVATALLLLALPMAGCVSDQMFADESLKPYGGSKQHPIKVSGGKATVDKCGDWSENLAVTDTNELADNHGCAVQSNIAAMAAYPADLVGKGHELPPPLGMVGAHAIQKITAASTASQGGSGDSGGATPATPTTKP